jgi:hypothetical protein
MVYISLHAARVHRVLDCASGGDHGGDGVARAAEQEPARGADSVLPDVARERCCPVRRSFVSLSHTHSPCAHVTWRLTALCISEFVAKHYLDMKKVNPKMPILIREAQNAAPRVVARFGPSATLPPMAPPPPAADTVSLACAQQTGGWRGALRSTARPRRTWPRRWPTCWRAAEAVWSVART